MHLSTLSVRHSSLNLNKYITSRTLAMSTITCSTVPPMPWTGNSPLPPLWVLIPNGIRSYVLALAVDAVVVRRLVI